MTHATVENIILGAKRAAKREDLLQRLASLERRIEVVRAYNSLGPKLAPSQTVWRELEAALAAVQRARSLVDRSGGP